MEPHVDHRPDQPDNTTDYTHTETHEDRCPKTAADFAYEAVNATGDHSEAATILRDAAEQVAEGGI